MCTFCYKVVVTNSGKMGNYNYQRITYVVFLYVNLFNIFSSYNWMLIDISKILNLLTRLFINTVSISNEKLAITRYKMLVRCITNRILLLLLDIIALLHSFIQQLTELIIMTFFFLNKEIIINRRCELLVS